MTYNIIRNGKKFGPFDTESLHRMANSGRILKCDMACDASNSKSVEEMSAAERTTVGDILKRAGLKVKVTTTESIGQQLDKIGSDIILPREDLAATRETWRTNSSLVMMAGVGVLPALLGLLSWNTFTTFYSIALYFSAVWALFFYYIFKTRQVSVRSTVTIFFLTQALVFLAWDVLGIVRYNPCYWMEDANTLIGKVIFFIGGVGLTEELAKALPLLLLASRAREPLVPQTMVYYGLMSGIGFGVFEGVQYQMSVNSELGYSESFMMNIARLTSLPFIHALWAGIAGYFISFWLIYPAYSRALLILAICVPAVLHGSYDLSCNVGGLIGWAFRIGIMLFSVLLLMTYLKRGKKLQERLRC